MESAGTVGVICITETWLDPSISNSEIKLNNYSVVRKDRNRNGGGNYINFTIETELEHDDNEVLLLDICLPKMKTLLMGVCYRQPN